MVAANKDLRKSDRDCALTRGALRAPSCKSQLIATYIDCSQRSGFCDISATKEAGDKAIKAVKVEASRLMLNCRTDQLPDARGTLRITGANSLTITRSIAGTLRQCAWPSTKVKRSAQCVASGEQVYRRLLIFERRDCGFTAALAADFSLIQILTGQAHDAARYRRSVLDRAKGSLEAGRRSVA